MKKLLHLQLNSVDIAIWEEELEDVRRIESATRLPLDGNGAFDAALIDDRIIYLYDLSDSLGLNPIDRTQRSHALVLLGENKTAGFAVGGDIEPITIEEEDVVPMPDCLRTEVIATCVKHDSRPIPIINLSLLHSNLQQPAPKKAESQLCMRGIDTEEGSSAEGFQTFSCCGHVLAMSHDHIETVHVRDECISKVPFFPGYVEGITIHKGKVVPLIRLPDCLGLERQAVPESAVILEEAEQCFGFLIDFPLEAIEGHSARKIPLPPLIAAAWMGEAVLEGQEVFPHILPLTLLQSQHSEISGLSSSQRYSLDSRFVSLLYEQEVEVLEFSILGRKCAIPECEAKEPVPLGQVWRVPTSNSIVTGVSKHEGSLIPVLDIAPYFGERSEPEPNWSMVVVENGTFKAFVLSEAVLGKRRLGIERQRELPYQLAKDFVYGCYIDEETVTLILNIASLAFQAENMACVDRIATRNALSLLPPPSELGTAPRSTSSWAGVNPHAPEADTPEADASKTKPEAAPEEPVASTSLAESESDIVPIAEIRHPTQEGPVDDNPSDSLEQVAADEMEAEDRPDLPTVRLPGKMEREEPPAPIPPREECELDEDHPHRGKKLLWYAVACVLFIALLVAGYSVLAPIVRGRGKADAGQRAAESQKPENQQVAGWVSVADERLEASSEIRKGGRETPASYLIHFPPDSSALVSDERESLTKIVLIIERNPPNRTIITGHTALIGTEESCLILSRERAETVRHSLLLLSALDESVIVTQGVGATEPVADNSTPQGRRDNRRVEIRLVY